MYTRHQAATYRALPDLRHKTAAEARDLRSMCSTIATPFKLHYRNHNNDKCDKCLFGKNRVRCEAITRLPDSERSWLIPRPLETEDWYVSCGSCEVAVAMNTVGVAWRIARLPQFRGRALQIQSFMRHSKSAMHRTACRVGGDRGH